MMTSIAGGLNTGIWLCAVVLGATGSAIIVPCTMRVIIPSG